MDIAKSGLAKVAICCAAFCVLAGLAYGMLYTTGCPVSPQVMGTLACWKILAPEFADDHGIIFELFTEPNSDLDYGFKDGRNGPRDWDLWRSKFNNLIAAVRNTLCPSFRNEPVLS